MTPLDKTNNDPDKLYLQATLVFGSTVRQAIKNLDRSGLQIVLVVDEDNKFIGTVSDGDIRRGLLKDLDLESSINTIVNKDALVVPLEMARDTVLKLMETNKIHQVPVVNRQHTLLGLHLWDKLKKPPNLTNLMVIMAGGKGTRLLPHTENCPKPMVELAGKPMLQHIIESAKAEGFTQFIISIYHLGHMIEDYFGDGKRFGVKIDYLREESPLGTAGALSLINPKPDKPFIVTNGDVITDIRYGDLLGFHEHYKASATMAVRMYEWQHPFGVVQTQGIEITGLHEKPVSRSHINAGVYALSPESLDELIDGAPCDMPMLFERLQSEAKRTIAYPMHEPWVDVGQPNDLRQANFKYSINTAGD